MNQICSLDLDSQSDCWTNQFTSTLLYDHWPGHILIIDIVWWLSLIVTADLSIAGLQRIYIWSNPALFLSAVCWLNYSDNFWDKSGAYLMGEAINLYFLLWGSRDPLQASPDCEPVSVNHSALVSFVKSNLDVIQRKAPPIFFKIVWNSGSFAKILGSGDGSKAG